MLSSEELQELPDVYVHFSHLLGGSLLRRVFRGYNDTDSVRGDREVWGLKRTIPVATGWHSLEIQSVNTVVAQQAATEAFPLKHCANSQGLYLKYDPLSPFWSKEMVPASPLPHAEERDHTAHM